MSEAVRLRELQAMALRLAAATLDDEARRRLLEMSEDLAAQADALEQPTDEPPLPAT